MYPVREQNRFAELYTIVAGKRHGALHFTLGNRPSELGCSHKGLMRRAVQIGENRPLIQIKRWRARAIVLPA